MNSKEMKEEIATEFSNFLREFEYSRKRKTFDWIREQPFGWDALGFRFIYIKSGFIIQFTAARRFEEIEKILGLFFQIPNYYRNDGKEVTMAFSANQVDGIYSIVSGYELSGYEYKVALELIQNHFLTKINPLLIRTQSLQGLHNFINVPPEAFNEKADFFRRDGGTLFRKMIIAKLVNDHYDEVCSFVFNRLSDGIASGQLNTETHDYLQIYHDVKRYLDHHFY